MHYQVVARTCTPSGEWDYYPYWAPVREKDAARRLASHAAQTGHEAAILHSVTAEMLWQIARGVVDRQDTHLLPALRFLPDQPVTAAPGRPEHGVRLEFYQSAALDAYRNDPDSAGLDGCRLRIELGPGGDVIQRPEWRPQHISLPRRMDVLRYWLDLRQRLLHGQIGGPTDGASAG